MMHLCIKEISYTQMIADNVQVCKREASGFPSNTGHVCEASVDSESDENYKVLRNVLDSASRSFHKINILTRGTEFTVF